MEKIFKGTLFNKSDKKLNISDVMRSSSKKNNFIENAIKKAKELGYKVTIK
jgi:spore germination protein YaaH